MSGTVFHVAAECTRANAKPNNCLDLGFRTSELSPEDRAEIIGWFEVIGSLAFRPASAFTDGELANLPDVIEKPVKGKQTDSQRLRAVLSLLAMEQKRDPKEYYHSVMEKLIDHYKQKLDELKDGPPPKEEG